MASNHSLLPAGNPFTRRDFLRVSTIAVAASESGRLVEAGSLAPNASGSRAIVEWRNKQTGMAYRKLGRTGMMISEVVSGGDSVKLDNYKQLKPAIEMGLNYLDMAPAYHRGDCELAYGKLLAGSSAKREKVFLTTKISNFNGQLGRMYKETFDGLPSEKKEAILKRAREMRERRGVEKPGYYFTYFPGQQNAFEPSYLRAAMLADYRHKVEGSSHGIVNLTIQECSSSALAA